MNRDYRIFDNGVALLTNESRTLFVHYQCASEVNAVGLYNYWARAPDNPVRCAICQKAFQLNGAVEVEPQYEHYLD